MRASGVACKNRKEARALRSLSICRRPLPLGSVAFLSSEAAAEARLASFNVSCAGAAKRHYQQRFRELSMKTVGFFGLSFLATLSTLFAGPPAAAEIIKKEDLLRGITMTAAQCAQNPQTVWVKAYGRNFCVRYYMSTAGGEGLRPAAFLQGDQLGELDPKTWTWKDVSEAKDVDTTNLMEMAHSFSKMVKTTAIYLARIGVDGTSGNHVARKTLLELHLMNAALDAIKRRHGFEGFHLGGQSGGATLVGALIRLRSDVACAVPGSGRLTTNTNTPPNGDS